MCTPLRALKVPYTAALFASTQGNTVFKDDNLSNNRHIQLGIVRYNIRAKQKAPANLMSSFSAFINLFTALLPLPQHPSTDILTSPPQSPLKWTSTFSSLRFPALLQNLLLHATDSSCGYCSSISERRTNLRGPEAEGGGSCVGPLPVLQDQATVLT